jgi:hypothetical protein
VIGEQHRSLDAGCVHDRANVVHTVLGGPEAERAARQALAPPIEHHDARVRRQSLDHAPNGRRRVQVVERHPE